jgi:hypothetical protein
MAELTSTSVVGALAMESRTEQAKRYRNEASKYVELASSGAPAIMSDVHRRLAERFIRMARHLERREEDFTNSVALLDKRK